MGSHGTSSFRGVRADEYAASPRNVAGTSVKGPYLDNVSTALKGFNRIFSILRLYFLLILLHEYC